MDVRPVTAMRRQAGAARAPTDFSMALPVRLWFYPYAVYITPCLRPTDTAGVEIPDGSSIFNSEYKTS